MKCLLYNCDFKERLRFHGDGYMRTSVTEMIAAGELYIQLRSWLWVGECNRKSVHAIAPMVMG